MNNKMTDTLTSAEEDLLEHIVMHIEEYYNEAEDWQETLDYIINLECNDIIHEIADGCVPVYTADILDCALEDLGLATTEPEIGPAFDGKSTAVNLIAANIYEDICNHLYEVEQKLKRKAVDYYEPKTTKEKTDGNK